VHLAVAAVNAGTLDTALSRQGALSTRSVAVSAPVEWRAGSILSGPPDEMRLFVKEIQVQDAQGQWTSLWKSSAAGGTSLSLTNSRIDLAQALAADLSLPAGSYTAVNLVLARVAQFSGCVSGKFISSSSVTALITAETQLGQYNAKHVGNTYTNDPISDGLVHTFCTQAARSELSQPTFSQGHIGFNAEFEAAAEPELVDVDLARSNDSGESPDAIRAGEIGVQSAVAFTVAAGAESRLTLAIDLNRQLRYFANTRTDFNPPNPGMKTGTSYFFTTIFPDTVMLVAGDVDGSASAGWIEGYALTITSGGSGLSGMNLEEWLTVIRSGSGAVLAGGILPDDDNDFTIAKGSLDPVACVDGGASGWTIGFRLGSEGTGSLDGFEFLDLGGSGTCALSPLPNPGAAGASFTVWYDRRL
jgi:hypothetical protein